MNNPDNFSFQARRTLLSKKTASFFLNGPPHSGHSIAVQSFANNLNQSGSLPKLALLGPYSISTDELTQLPKMLGQDLLEKGFLAKLPENDSPEMLHQAWSELTSLLEISRQQSFLVMIDLAEPYAAGDIEPLANLFSAIRTLESQPHDRNFGLYHLVTGFWNPNLLAGRFDAISVSFPYSVGANYAVWEGILEPTEISPLFNFNFTNTWEPLLIEVTGGHLGVLQELAKSLNKNDFSLHEFLSVIDHLAQYGTTAQELVRLWQCFLPDISPSLQHLLPNKIIHLNHVREIQDLLLAAGIGKLTKVGGQYFFEIKSWYIERVMIHHSNALDIGSQQLIKHLLNEPYPQLLTFNQQAYQLLNDIETKARLFVSNYLNEHNASEQHVLKNQVPHLRDQYENAYERATAWKGKNSNKGLHTHYNPLIVYCSTSDLAEMIEKIGFDEERAEWKDVAKLVRNLVPIRDAVMHNQLIDETSLQRLYSLKEQIYCLIGSPDTNNSER